MTDSVCAQAPLALTAHVIAWSLMLQLLVGAGLGWLLARRRFAGRQLVDALVSLPLVFPPIVLGYGLLVLLGRQGLLTQLLPDVLRPDIVFSQTGLVIAAFIAGLPLMVKPTQAAFAGTSPRLLEAAAMLGHRPWSVFWRIELPLARRGIAAGLILSGGAVRWARSACRSCWAATSSAGRKPCHWPSTTTCWMAIWPAPISSL